MKTTVCILLALLAGATAPAQVTNRWLTRPATIGAGPTTLTALLKYPEAEARAKQEMEVAFFCDVSKEGRASNFLLYRPADPSNAFVVAVRKALDTAIFEPAISQGQPVIVQLAASVIFAIENGRPTPLVRLNISDQLASERNYTGPQLIGGQSALLLSVGYPDIARAQRMNGTVDLAFDIDTAGIPRNVRVSNVNPPGYGFDEAALVVVRKARFIPAMFQRQPLKAPSTQRIEFNIQVIERYSPMQPPKKKGAEKKN